MRSNWHLREEIGDIEALSNERKKAFESLALLGVEFAVKKRSDVDIFWIVVEMSISTDPKHHRRRFAQSLRRRTELREHPPFLFLSLERCMNDRSSR